MAGHSDTFHHVRDYEFFELPFGQHIELPEILGLQLTKFMILQVVAAVLALGVFVGLARRARSGDPIKGRFWNFWEAIALFIRDEVVRPTIGDDHHHDHGDGEHGHDDGHHAAAHGDTALAHPGDKYLPFIWSCFFYVLFCNLLGAIPFLGSPTGELNVTGALAATAFVMTVACSVEAIGVGGFFKNFFGGLELNSPLDVVIGCVLFGIELIGFFIKHAVLAVRLFANMMGGHTVLGVMLAFIASAAHSWLYYLVTPASVLGQVGIGLLELFVAFLQAYVFAFLATIFISMAIHEH